MGLYAQLHDKLVLFAVEFVSPEYPLCVFSHFLKIYFPIFQQLLMITLLFYSKSKKKRKNLLNFSLVSEFLLALQETIVWDIIISCSRSNQHNIL